MGSSVPDHAQRIAMLSLHTSPLAALGGKKTGGMNVYVREVAAELGAAGVTVDVFTREASPEMRGQVVRVHDHVHLIHLPAGPLETLSPTAIYRYLPEFHEAFDAFIHQHHLCYDIIYSHYWLSGWVALAIKRQYGVPVVQMFHTLGRMKDRIDHQSQPLDSPIISLQEPNIRVAVETEIMEQADCIIAATQAERMQLMWLYRANRSRIEIVPPGVALDHFRPMDRQVAKAQIGLAPHQRMFLFVGRIEPLKAVDTICEALALLKTDNPAMLNDLYIYIVGGDPDDTTPDNHEMIRLRELCRQLGLEDVVLFVGAKEQAVLPAYYNAAEALIMPSDYESFGMVALEAMACGTPVIASQVGGLAFLVQDNETGFHVPVREPHMLAERMHTLLFNPEKRQEMGQKARQVAESYSWQEIVRQLLQVFRNVRQNGGGDQKRS